MTDATQLREALDAFPPNPFKGQKFATVVDAARTIALPILEQDEGLVERIANAIWNGLKTSCVTDVIARDVLAALIPEDSE